MRRSLRQFPGEDSGGAGAEFALVVPLLLAFLFGIIDVGRAMWTWNRAEKATEVGVRFAVATDVIPGDLASLDFTTVVSKGQVIPESSFGTLTCDRTTCTCDTGPCYSITAMNSTAFDAMVTRMQYMMPEIAADNVRVQYSSSGLGYAGDPNGPDISPLVTVSLVDLTFQPVTFLVFGQTLDLPGFPATLSLEDGSGRLSN